MAYEDLIATTAQKYGIPTNLLTAVVRQESGFNPQARSPAGAMGLMQLMPGTARSLGVTNPLDPVQSLNGGARYLSDQYKSFGSWDKALAAYNAGPGNVQKYGGIPPFKETQNYVKNILGNIGNINNGLTTSQQVPQQVLALQRPSMPQVDKMNLYRSVGIFGDKEKDKATTGNPMLDSVFKNDPLTRGILASRMSINRSMPTPTASSGGYSSSNPLMPSNSGNLGTAVNTALSVVGKTPYVWGGTNLKKGVDCSGLTQLSYAAAGVKIPRVADDQFRAAPVKLNRSQLTPGDLVFFKKKNSGTVHHTGIYLGNDQYVHAPQTGRKVEVGTLSKRSDFYAGGRY